MKEELLEELGKETPDPFIVAELTDKLLDGNSDAVRFTVDASHVNRLGLELVAKQETALSEIIKNGYDADASIVTIDFKNHDKVDGELNIRDDGHGMNEASLKNAWMRLSTPDKVDNPNSPGFDRKRAGKKGIGRFAVQRLGKKLILETAVKELDFGLKIEFDWDDFSSGKSLTNIWSSIEKYQKPPDQHGTTLRILKLRDRWTDGKIKNVWKSVLLLQPPYKLSRIDDDHKKDPGFKLEINGKTSLNRTTSYSIEKDLLAHATAEIFGEINEKGEAKFRLISKRYNIDEKHTSDKLYLATGPLKLETRYFIHAKAWASSQTDKLQTRLAREYGGVRVYRNGFRVAPYGDPKDDWLALSDKSARRVVLQPMNNNNFFGHVELFEDCNPYLEETSSREGLVENEAFEDLQDFIMSCLKWATNRIGEVRMRKTTPSQKGFTPTDNPEAPRPTDVIRSKIKDFQDSRNQEMKDNDASSDAKAGEKNQEETSAEEILGDVLEISEEFEAEHDKKIAEMLEYEGMLRILASLGLTISMFAHELKGAKNGVDRSLLLLERDIGSDDERLNELKQANQRVFSLGGYIDALISHQESRELKSRSVLGIVERFVEQFRGHLDKDGIEIDYKVVPDHVRTCPVHRSEIDSVFFNFLTNSSKAINKANTKNPKILITAKYVHVDDDIAFIEIRFEDNGIGIPEGTRERIFNAFYTTTTPGSSDVDGVGTGLGLKIVSDIAENYGGEVSLQEPSAGFVTCFEFLIPAENLNDPK